MNAMVQHQQTSPHNPFGAQLATRETSNAIADAGQQREIAEVQAAMVIAKKFPRDPINAMERILNACTRPTLAEGALYSYSRGGTEVTGPSIRLAEAIAQAWGNVQFGIRELEQRGGESTVEAYAWDLESNTRQAKVFQVPHIRYTKKGAQKLSDPRDIYELVANQGARRLRACILGVVPGDVTEAAVNACEQTLKASADVSPEGIKKLLAAFSQFGVTKEQIEKRIQSRIDAIRPAQVVQLKKVYQSLRDGMSSPVDWFEADAAASATTEKIAAAAKRPAATKTAEPDLTPAATGLPGYDEIRASIDDCTDPDTLDLIADQIRDLQDEAQIRELTERYQARRAELTQ